jgi:hypothetical protein
VTILYGEKKNSSRRQAWMQAGMQHRVTTVVGRSRSGPKLFMYIWTNLFVARSSAEAEKKLLGSSSSSPFFCWPLASG